MHYIINFIISKNNIEDLKQNLYFQIITFCNQIYDIWLINIILEILLKRADALSILTLLIYLIFLLYRLVITKVQLFLQQNTFNLSNQTFLIYIAQTLNLVQIGIFCFNTQVDGIMTFYLGIIGLLINIAIFTNAIIYFPYLNKNIFFIVFAIHFNSIIYNLFNLISLESELSMGQIELLFIFQLPMNFKIAIYYYSKKQLLTIEQQSNPSQIVNLILELKSKFQYSKQRILIESIVSKGIKKVDVEPLRLTVLNQEDIYDFYIRLSLKHQELVQDDFISHLSLLLKLEFYFQAFLYISKWENKKGQTILNKIKFLICARKCRQKLNYHMMQKNNFDTDKDFELNIKKFMDIESKNLELCKRIVILCQKKIEYFKDFDYDQIDKLYSKSNTLVLELDKLKDFVQNLYRQYPSNRMQNILAFIYAELLNDYLSAMKVFCQAALQEDKIYKNVSNLKIDLYSTKTTYLMVNLDNMQIIRNSSNAYDFFQVDQLILDDLIPNGIKDYHPSMIKTFIKTGKSKFFRNVQEGLIAKKGFCEGVNIVTEILFEKNQLNALILLSIQDENQIIMVVDNQHKIVGLSEEFFEIVGGSSDQIELIYGIPVDYVIPKFKFYVEDNQVQQIQLRFLTKPKLFDFVTLLIHYKQKRNITDLMDGCWLDQYNYDTYSTHCCIQNNDDKYYIVRFNYLKNATRRGSQSASRTLTQKSYFQQNGNNLSEIEMDEQIEMLIPYEESEPKYINDIVILQNPDLLLSNRESHNNDGIGFLVDDQFHAKNESQSKTYQPLQSLQQQQKYFIEKSKINQKYSKSNHDDSQDVQMEGQSSQVSQLSGQKKAFYYKKYILMEKMLQSPNTNQIQKILIFFVMLQLTVFIVQIIVSLTQSSSTLNQYLTNIDLLQIKYYLFQPVESFIVTRYTIINYNAQFTAKSITKSELDKYLVFPNSNLNLGFDDVQQNQAAILNRLTLQDFLAQYYDFYIYIKTDIGELYNITMRQSLSILINYQYTFKAAYKYDGRTVSDSPYIFYSYRNLLTLYNAFDQLNSELYIQSNLRIELDLDKELTLFYPFVILILIIISFQIFWFLKNQGRIASLLGFMTFNEAYTIQQDVDRFNHYVESISKSSDTLFKYQFQIDKKENQLKLQQKQLQIETSIKRLQYQKRLLSNKSGYCLILIQFIILISFSIAKYYVNLNYFTQFKPTAYFYQQITDLGTNIPTIYAMREVLYYRWRYPFYNDDDLEQILDQIIDCLAQVQNVTAYIQNLQINQYLLSSDFSDYIQSMSSTNICNFLDDSMKEKSMALCQITLGGSFLNGLTGSLIYIYTNIQNEMQINQFLNKTENTRNELEGVFIISQVIKQINTYMKADLTNQTNNILSSIIYLCVFALIFVVISIIFLFYIINPFLKRQYYIAKRYLYLIPQQTLFLDDAFERLARSVMQDQQIMA
ncbi:unnamed protein product [Paramecium primaurelia]|uniref:PAS domain-containing protein n=1 Tax=Paramecium primaurelia TaxID=5886 RepID=A0A8S1NUZ7_PARPR|nr:unnamed protein product [Paramecium primaurelia]